MNENFVLLRLRFRNVLNLENLRTTETSNNNCFHGLKFINLDKYFILLAGFTDLS